jgi:hypothetical protein
MYVVLFDCVERVTVVLSLMSLIFTRKMIDTFLEVVIKPFKYHEAELLTQRLYYIWSWSATYYGISDHVIKIF